MSSVSIVAPRTGSRLALSRSAVYTDRSEAENYEIYRSIIDAYEEVERPSIVDVRAGAYSVGAVVEGRRGQNVEMVSASAAPRDWLFQYSKEDARTHRRVPITVGGQDRVVETEKLGVLSGRGRDTTEGRTFRFVLSPGWCGTRQIDTNKAGKTAERLQDATRRRVDMLNTFREEVNFETGEITEVDLDFNVSGRTEITEWSAKSRANMTKTTGALDYTTWTQAEGALAMVTFTLPDRWQEVAPTGKDFKKIVKRMRMRWERAGMQWRCLWKLEFQGRGAPHLHCLMRVPALVKGEIFERWLSRNWADAVGASTVVDREDGSSEYSRNLGAGTRIDFSGKDFSDPTRISMYFAGHSSKTTDGKEYQHFVPEEWQAPGAGPGRFWGFAGLGKAVVEVDMPEKDYKRVQRVMRHVAKARAWKIAVLREKGRRHREGLPVDGFSAFDVHAKKGPRSRFGGGGGYNGGWVLMNDPIAFAFDLSRHLEG